MERTIKSWRPMRVCRIMRRMHAAWGREHQFIRDPIRAHHRGIVWYSKQFYPEPGPPGIVWFRAMGDHRKSAAPLIK